jgi:Tfp pilus assembly protein FimT
MLRGQRGFTFLDMLLVVVIVASIAAYGMMRQHSTGENTLWYQAHGLARDLRHVQVLTATYGRPLQLTATAGVNGTYSVSCVTAGAAPCDASPIIDPATGEPFSVSLQHDVSLAVSGTNPLAFDMQGRPLNGGAVSTTSTTYTLTASGTTSTVTVSPITGFVGVSP